MRPLVKRIACALCALAWLTLGAVPGHAEKRIALVVGNDRYPNLQADKQLEKAVNNSRSVGNALGELGFEVIHGENLGQRALFEKLDAMAEMLSPGDTAFFFFAGHGVAINGGNYILPSDVPQIEAGQEARLIHSALSESDVVLDLQQRGVRVAVVVLDACRDNPFKRPGVRSIGAERGLERIEPVRGVFTFYSAGLGQTALDRLSDADRDPNSVFTRVLVPELSKSGVDLTALAIDVREEVARLAATVGHDQRPAYYDETIGGRVYLAGLSNGEAKTPLVVQPTQIDPAEHAWAVTKDTTSLAVLEDFIRQFGSTPYGSMARARLNELQSRPKAEETRPPVVQPTQIDPAEHAWAVTKDTTSLGGAGGLHPAVWVHALWLDGSRAAERDKEKSSRRGGAASQVHNGGSRSYGAFYRIGILSQLRGVGWRK